MKYMPGDYVNVDTGETVNSLVFERLKKTNEIRTLRKFKQTLKHGHEERIYTTIEYEDKGRLYQSDLFGG